MSIARPPFVPGLELAASFYADVVGPALVGVRHTSALLGCGSDVLGYDDACSTDHGWGPRLQVFVDSTDVDVARRIVEAALPESFRGWPTRFGWDAVPVQHHVDVTTIDAWLRDHLGFDPRGGVTTDDWLSTPQQLLLEATAGAVFTDGLTALHAARTALDWYPDDVWRCLLAAQWRRIAQEEAFVARTADTGDALGSRIVTARLTRDVMRLCFLLERRYAPYTKWLGTAFARLAAALEVGPHLDIALAAGSGPDRERGLAAAFQSCARRQNDLGLVERVDPTLRPFHRRPFLVLGADRCVDACRRSIVDPALRARAVLGAIDQLVDSTDVLSSALAARRAFIR